LERKLESSHKEQKEQDKSWFQRNQESIRTIAIALILAFLLRTFIIEPRYIPSGSMEPTLLVNDRIIVEKVSYWFREPQRGEILVFYPPKSPAIEDSSKAYIKRLIGLPGDRISIHDGKVFVNDKAISESYIAEPPEYSFSSSVTVPPGYYWMMGDNRNSSNDSHVWGFLPRQNIIGRAFFRFFPFGDRIGELKTPNY
jgi:signal peptidase I